MPVLTLCITKIICQTAFRKEFKSLMKIYIEVFICKIVQTPKSTMCSKFRHEAATGSVRHEEASGVLINGFRFRLQAVRTEHNAARARMRRRTTAHVTAHVTAHGIAHLVKTAHAAPNR